MNIVRIDHAVAIEMKRSTNREAFLRDMVRLVGKTDYSLTHFSVMPKASNVLFWLEYEILDPDRLPRDAMNDYIGTGPVIKYTNHFARKLPDSVMDGRMFSSEDVISMSVKRSVYIHPQIQNDEVYGAMLDLYTEPVGDSDFDGLSDNQNVARSVFALQMLNYVDSRLKKERRRITKLMPTPEQIQDADNTQTVYKSNVITIKGVTVQYIYEPHKARRYNRSCEAWGVRGHYRHYKSGKVVYIRPHTKGIGKIKDTIYRFAEEDK